MIDTISRGIFPSDIVIRTAIMAGFDDLRKNPYLLDFCFAFFQGDELTKNEYGEKQLEEAKKWFLSTKIPVIADGNLNNKVFPSISISLDTSRESNATLSDQNLVDVQEEITSRIFLNTNSNFPKFIAQNYCREEGKIYLPDSFDDASIFVGNVVTDDNRIVVHEILDVGDDADGNFIVIEPESDIDVKNIVIAPIENFSIALLESREFEETYNVQINTGSSPLYLTWLWAITKFVLLRYNFPYLDGRGFERAVFESSAPKRVPAVDAKEILYVRTITVKGFVRHFWPREITGVIAGVRYGIDVSELGGVEVMNIATI